MAIGSGDSNNNSATANALAAIILTFIGHLYYNISFMSKLQLYILSSITLIVIVGLLMIDPIPQDQAYHSFADQRTLYSIPNFWNVISNLPFLFIGLYGVYLSTRNYAARPDWASKGIPLVLCAGMFLACFGSMYYHWAPDNHTLVWDRLPMTFMFMPVLALIVYDFLGVKAGQWAFTILVPLGALSVFYWDYTESIGQGDLRLYAFVQFFPMLIVPIIWWFSAKKVPYGRYILYTLGWYVLTKLAEHFDFEIYELLGFMSGHPIKHLLGGVTMIYILKLIVAWEKELIEV